MKIISIKNKFSKNHNTNLKKIEKINKRGNIR